MDSVLELVGGLGYVLLVVGGWALVAGILSAAGLGRRLRTSSYSYISRCAPSLAILWILARLRRPSAIVCLAGGAMLVVYEVARSNS